jgi:hypothetical protein
MAEAKELTTVTPICTVAKTDLDHFSGGDSGGRFYAFSKSSMRFARGDTAISAAGKPFARIKANISLAQAK